MIEHVVTPQRATLHGKWSADLEPAARIRSGDAVIFRDVLDVGWGFGQHDRIHARRDKWIGREDPRDSGPAMHGPIHIAEAEVGTTLAVHIETIDIGGYGWTVAGSGLFNAELNAAVGVPPETFLLLWSIDARAGTATSEHGITLPIRPFFGTIGLCPPGAGWHEGWFPTAHGGNMDLPELTAGTTLYLPVAQPGALCSLGDAHARQGDGELSGSAIEVPVREARLRFEVRRDFPVTTVTADTPNGWVTAGFDRDLDRAIHQAVSAMLDLLQRNLEIDRAHAMALASAAVDVRTSQLVNGVRGAHARLHPELRLKPLAG